MGSYLLCIAIDAAAPMLVGIVRPGFIFVICCRIFAFADGAGAHFPAAQAGAGFRLGVAGVIFAGAGMGAVAVGYPFPVVIQRVQFLIGGVNAPPLPLDSQMPQVCLLGSASPYSPKQTLHMAGDVQSASQRSVACILTVY